jgi:ATP-binding cassette subfamily B protein
MTHLDMDGGMRSEPVRVGLRLMARTLLGYRGETVRSIAGALLWMATIVVIPILVSRAVDSVVVDRALESSWIVWLVVFGVLQAIGIGTRRYYGFKLSYRAEADLRNRMFAHMQRLAFSFHDQTSTGQLMSRASSDLGQVRLVFAMLPITTANLALLLLVAAVLMAIDLPLGLAASATIPLLLIAANRFAGKVIATSFEVQERLADLSAVVEEAIGGIQVVKAYGQEAQEQGRLDDSAAAIFDASTRLARKTAVYSPLFEFIPSLGTLIVLALGGVRLIDGSLTPGEFVAFTLYLAALVLPIRITGWFFANLPRAAAAGARVEELLVTDPDVADPVQPLSLPAGRGEIRFAGVTFAYPDGPPVLEGVDLLVPGGTSLALVGSTGSGKTTIAHLIPRFHDVDDGAVTIDGVDVRDVSLDALRSEVAVVFQETFLFSASLRDNIAVGAPSAPDEQIRAAARLAKAHEFICEMPKGYDTVVGERGLSLSGGQRQRVALARAVVRDPRVLILDDATSSVDAVVEAEIQAALRRVMEGRTTVIVAHRTSTLALVDQVAFVDDGRVVAVGRHEDLIATVPRYGEVLASSESRELL